MRLIARELGFNLIEQNASDLRNKSAVKGTLSTLTENRSLNGDAELGRSLILMDEVDGMSSDRGGTQMLNDYIKKTRVPIICIANDRQHPKMRTLAGNCYDLRFQKPNKAKLIHRIKEICSKEGVTVDENSVQHLVDEMNSDVRQILGFLQMYTRTNKTFIYATFKTKSSKFAKDKAVTISNFDAATILLNREQVFFC